MVINAYKTRINRSNYKNLLQAFAEKLHEYVRTKLWPYAPNENYTIEELFKLKYEV